MAGITTALKLRNGKLAKLRVVIFVLSISFFVADAGLLQELAGTETLSSPLLSSLSPLLTRLLPGSFADPPTRTATAATSLEATKAIEYEAGADDGLPNYSTLDQPFVRTLARSVPRRPTDRDRGKAGDIGRKEGRRGGRKEWLAVARRASA